MSDPRLYALLCCVGLLGRWLYHAALNELNEDFYSWGAFITLWLPIAILLGLAISFVLPFLTRKVASFRRR